MTESQTGGVRETAQQQGAAVAREAKAQANHVVRNARDRMADEAEQQARKASNQLSRIADELSSMADGSPSESMTAGAIRQVADSSRQAARYLDERGARGLLDTAQDFARRRPGAFLLGAAVAGFLVGRVAKSATGDAGKSGQNTEQYTGRYTGQYTGQPAESVPRANPEPEFAAAAPGPRTPDLSPMTHEPPFVDEGTRAPGPVTGHDPTLPGPAAPGPVRPEGVRHVES